MKVVKFLLGVVFLGVIGYVGLSVATNRGLVSDHYLSTVNNQLRNVQVPSTESASGLVEQAQSSVLGVSTAISENTDGLVQASKPPMAQQAFEYARYNYCQAVVRDYESRYGSSN